VADEGVRSGEETKGSGEAWCRWRDKQVKTKTVTLLRNVFAYF